MSTPSIFTLECPTRGCRFVARISQLRNGSWSSTSGQVGPLQGFASSEVAARRTLSAHTRRGHFQ